MKNKMVKRFLAGVLSALLAVGLLAGCGGNADDKKGSDKQGSEGGTKGGSGITAEFTWWLYTHDGQGMYYEDYEDSPVVQYVNQQYWDIENGGIAKDGNGNRLHLSFLTPITGEEMNNFNTMLSTGDYPEMFVLHAASESPQAMCESGILMEVTKYVEKYMPNYLAYLDANPELKPLVTVKSDDGKIHYYSVHSFVDGVEDPWEGTCYRRDWVVKYAQPTEYVWDWESDYVKENGHPEVTPLEKAVKENKLEGWKKNEVTEFTSDYGENPAEDYTDNVIFPSGKSDPITISDWEWMFEAFEKAIDERGWSQDSNAYVYTIPSSGNSASGDITSSFGGGTGSYYVKDGEVTYDGTSENFKTYLECMKHWYEKGWLDSQFYTRAGDAFYQINTAGTNQGKVGMWCGMISSLGTAIRVSCQNEEDAADAYVMGCALPINDMYGSEDQMYKEPDSMFQSSRKGTGIGITTKAEEKSEEELATLFTYLDWAYTMEGARTIRLGLTAEQLASVTLDPDLYAEYDVKNAYDVTENEEGVTVYKANVDKSSTLFNATIGQRMDIGLKPTTNEKYIVDTGNPKVNQSAVNVWKQYLNKGGVLVYSQLLNTEEAESYSKISTALNDYQAQSLPNVIRGTMSWEDYVDGINALKPEAALEYLQKYVDLANVSKGIE
jgi:hypothetical protein